MANQPDDACASPAALTRVPIYRYDGDAPAKSDSDPVVQEARVELVLNEQPLLAMLCLPQQIEELALGFLYCEGLLADAGQLPLVHYDAGSGQIHCQGSFDQDRLEQIHRRWSLGTGCGGGGTARDLSVLARYPALPHRLTVRADQLARLGRQFQQRGQLYRQTGGVHACAVATAEDLLLFAEDVGRHNAFDKVIGMALRQPLPLDDKLALTTGRITAEITTKAIASRMQLLASSSAATGLGIDLARRANLTLVGFLRGTRMNVYSGYWRVPPPGPADRPG